MKTFFKVIGKILAVFLGIILFAVEISYAIVGPAVNLAADVLNNPSEIIKEVDINELFENSEFAQQYYEIVLEMGTAINFTVTETQELLNSGAVKDALGKVADSVVKVALGDDSAKLTNSEITDIVVEAAKKFVEGVKGLQLPEKLEEYVSNIVDEIGIDNIYDQLKGIIMPTNYSLNGKEVISINHELTIDVVPGISIAKILKYFANNVIKKSLIITIVIIVALIFLCQFSVFGGLLETGVVTLLSSIAPFGIYGAKDIVGALLKDELPFDLTKLPFFNAFLKEGILMSVIGVMLIIAAIIYKKVKKNKVNELETEAEIKDEETDSIAEMNGDSVQETSINNEENANNI